MWNVKCGWNEIFVRLSLKKMCSWCWNLLSVHLGPIFFIGRVFIPPSCVCWLRPSRCISKEPRARNTPMRPWRRPRLPLVWTHTNQQTNTRKRVRSKAVAAVCGGRGRISTFRCVVRGKGKEGGQHSNIHQLHLADGCVMMVWGIRVEWSVKGGIARPVCPSGLFNLPRSPPGETRAPQRCAR